MNTMPDVVRVEDRERFEILRRMREDIKAYYEEIKLITKLYQDVSFSLLEETEKAELEAARKKEPPDHGTPRLKDLERLEIIEEWARWKVPLPTYINFRDALCHYSRACHYEEGIQLIQAENAISEHLHRAVKDMATIFLQTLGRRMAALYWYMKKSTGQTTELTMKDGKTLADMIEELYRSNREDEVCGVLTRYLKLMRNQRMYLRKHMHTIRNLDLSTRHSSLNIKKPFKAAGAASVPMETDSESALAVFHKSICDCIAAMKQEGLYELVFYFGKYFEQQAG